MTFYGMLPAVTPTTAVMSYLVDSTKK